MTDIFNLCLTNSLNISFFIILLVLLEPFLKKYLSAVCLYRLWVVLLIGLLIPIRFDASKALFYISIPRITVEDKADHDIDVQGSDDSFIEIEKNTLSQTQVTQIESILNNHQLGNKPNFFKDLLPTRISGIVQNRYLLLSLLWILGAFILLLIKGMEHYKYLKQLKRFIEPVDREDFIEEYNQCIRELHLNSGRGLSQHRRSMICKCSIIASPMTIGILKPRIILPSGSFSKKEFYFIVKHELIHIRRRDSLVKLVRLIVLSLNWYNPLCYILSRHMEEWCEASCDELVLQNLSRSDCLGYSKLLLKYITVKKNTVSIINMIGGKDNMKNRLHSIIEQRKKHPGKLLVALLLCIVFTTVIVSVNSRKEVSAAKDNIVASEEPSVQSEEAAAENISTGDNSVEDIAAGDISVAGNTLENKSAEDNTTDLDSLREAIVQYATQAEGTPYLWGGADLSEGVDSSGFTQAIYQKIGYDLPRTSREQASSCEEVSMDNLQPGDLIFYADTEDNITNHVGIYIGEDKIIHAKNARDGVTIQDINYRTPFGAGRVISDEN
jgi:cell wall-associated NlpC family hydrolase